MHPHARFAAQAALAASEQGKFWPMFDLLYSHQDELIPSEVQYYATQEMPTLNINKFVSDTSSPTVVSRVDQQIKFVQSLKIGATPTFIVRKTSGGTPAWYVGTKDTPVSQGLNHFIAAPPWLKASG
jgi:protein-disulfide isomerase